MDDQSETTINQNKMEDQDNINRQEKGEQSGLKGLKRPRAALQQVEEEQQMDSISKKFKEHQERVEQSDKERVEQSDKERVEQSDKEKKSKSKKMQRQPQKRQNISTKQQELDKQLSKIEQLQKLKKDEEQFTENQQHKKQEQSQITTGKERKKNKKAQEQLVKEDDIVKYYFEEEERALITPITKDQNVSSNKKQSTKPKRSTEQKMQKKKKIEPKPLQITRQESSKIIGLFSVYGKNYTDKMRKLPQLQKYSQKKSIQAVKRHIRKLFKRALDFITQQVQDRCGYKIKQWQVEQKKKLMGELCRIRNSNQLFRAKFIALMHSINDESCLNMVERDIEQLYRMIWDFVRTTPIMAKKQLQKTQSSQFKHSQNSYTPASLFSQEKTISEDGLESIIVSKWISTIIKNQKDLQNNIRELKEISKGKKEGKERKEEQEKRKEKKKEIKGRIRDQNRESLRDKILKITFKDITDEVKKAVESFGSADIWSVNKQSQKIFQKMKRQFFEQGVNFDLSVSYNQGRFRKAIGERSENKYAIFYPTHFSAGPIFKHIYQLQDRYLLLGTSGTGKSLSLVFMTMFSEIISRYLFESHGSPQSSFLLGSKLIIKIPKMFYVDISTASQDNIYKSIRGQCGQLNLPEKDYQNKDQINRSLGSICDIIKEKYLAKGIEVLVIRDQVNKLTGQYRKADMFQKNNMLKGQESTDYFRRMMKIIQITNQLASSYPLQSASNNMEIGLVFQRTNNILPFPQHDGLYVFRTPYTPFTWVTKREIANYLLFELTQRGYISKQEYQNLNQQPQKKQQIFELFENLAVIPKDITPKKIRQTLDNEDNKKKIEICVKQKKKLKQSISFLLNILQQKTEQNISDFLSKNNLTQNYLRTVIIGFYINLAKSYTTYKLIKQKMKDQFTNDEIVQIQNQINSFEEAFCKPQKVKLSQKNEDKNQITDKDVYVQTLSDYLKIPFGLSKKLKESTFNHDLFEIVKNQGQDSFSIVPYLKPQEFLKCLQNKFNQTAPHIIKQFTFQDGKNLRGYAKICFNQIFKKPGGGHKYEEVIFNCLKKGNFILNKNFIVSSSQLTFIEFKQDIQKNSSSKFQDHFEKIFEETEQGSYFLRPQDKNGKYSKYNPSIDFVIVRIRKRDFDRYFYQFETFDATISIPFTKVYYQKAQKALRLFSMFEDLKKQNQSTKNYWIKIHNKKDCKKVYKEFVISHHILGLKETKSVLPKKQMNKVNGVASINYMNIKDFDVVQISNQQFDQEKEYCSDFKLLQEINALLLSNGGRIQIQK